MKKNKFFNIGISRVSLILSIINLLLFHYPFFRHVFQNTEGGFNGMVIVTSLILIMLVANYFAFYLFLYLGRFVGKTLIAITFILSAVGLYFINAYDIMIDETMMGNVFNTKYSEASSYFSLTGLLYLIFLGLLPATFVFLVNIDYGKLRKFFARIGISLVILIVIAFGNMTNWPWIDKNATVIGSLLLPWSYTVNSVRYQMHQRENNRKEIPLPDATIKDSKKSVVVLIIGESARRDHFSLYGYQRQTNPRLKARESLRAFKAESSATYTTGGVKAMLDYTTTSKLYEILPNYLYRNGVDVIWRSSNWGQPPLHIKKYYTDKDLAKKYPSIDPTHDDILIAGVGDIVKSSDKNKVFIVLHTSTSHGPTYYKRYPANFEKFTPVCRSVEMSSCPQQEVINAYDNTILYTDYLIDNVIEQMSTLTEWESTVIYVSDHGESLGEKNLYMHGVPKSIAPKEQYEIPFLVWTSDKNVKFKNNDELLQYHVFHSVLSRLSVSSPIYNNEMDIFEK
ncbi:MAG: phosphoethanolamine--lipid A transferase EptA [Alistipes sp.]|nr:phosphoethanolamine--lipid A transferase EptA [Candidatus Alistipes equi]